MTRKLVSVVGGNEVAEPAAGTYVSVNPSRRSDSVADVTLANPELFGGACRTARTAQREWSNVPAPVRGRVIASIGRIVEANKDALARILTRELGKPFPESLGEIQEIIDTCEFFLGEGRRLYGQTVSSEMPNKQLFTFREPVGVVAVVTAGNFPVAVPSWYIVPALLCGNAVVWKPAEYAAATARALYDLVTASGLPEGLLNIVYADGPATFDGLQLGLAEGTIDKVGFTGSSAVGSRVGELCGRYLQSPCLELGGKNPMIVMPDAALDVAVESALFAGYGTAGQRCTSLGTVIAHEEIYDSFARKFRDAVSSAPVGDPTQDVVYGPMLEQRFADRFEGYLGWIDNHHRVSGSTATGRITGSNPRKGFVGDPDTGLYYHPVIVEGVRPDDKLFTEETFGPIACVTPFHSIEQAIELANAPGYGLSAAIYSNDPKAIFTFRRGVSAGMLSINNSTSQAEAHMPFGGNGRSGNGGRQSGMWVLDQFTRWQAVNWDYSGRLQKAQMDTTEIVPDLEFRL
jgi:alpha-ketoglutaric semialdehyde dehydrogenase